MSASASHTSTAGQQEVNCMEVWGGNRTADDYISRPGLDVCVWSNPQGHSQAAGGDVHFLSSCASGRITRMLIADVCAQGTVFSELASEFREVMMRNVNRIQQASFVREMNRRLQGFAGRGGFSTALVATFFAPTKSFALCNTGNPPPFLYRAKRQQWSAIKQDATKLQGVEHTTPGVVAEAEYQHFDLRLEKGDMVLGYSNSLSECCDANNQYLGVDGLLERLARIDAEQPSKIPARLAAQIQNENAANLAADDATIILSRVTDNRVRWKDNLLAPFRLLGSVSDKTQLQ